MPDKFGWDNNFGNSRIPKRKLIIYDETVPMTKEQWEKLTKEKPAEGSPAKAEPIDRLK